MTTQNIPAHIPMHLVRDFDYQDMKGEKDLFRHFTQLHDGPDLFFTPRNGGHWVATRYDDMDAILSNNKDFSSHHASLPKNPFPIPMVEYDEPLHTDFRKLLAPFFSPKSIGNLQTLSRDICISLIDGFYANGECEFVRDFGQRMPIMIIMGLLELPDEDTPYLLGISELLVRNGDPDVLAGCWVKLIDYIAEKVIPLRRAKPGKDIFSILIHGTIDGGRPVADREIVQLGSLLIAAGLDTVASLMGFVALFLASNPSHRQQLLDNPELLNTALEEIMRRHHVTNISRMVINDMTFKDVRLAAGDVILVPTTLAGLDERHYPAPFTVDFHRKDKKHLMFGCGPHQCIGAFLARTELRVFVTEWLRRIPHFEIRQGEEPVVAAGKANAVRYLPLTWQVPSAS